MDQADAPEELAMDAALHARCVYFHERLAAHPLSWPFLAPVDPVAMNLPTYLDIISSPMDLSTMWTKLQAHEYDSPDAYRRDMVLMFENAIEFNKDDTHEDSVGEMAKKLLALSLDEWEKTFSEVRILCAFMQHEATTDWKQVTESQLQAQVIQRARDAQMVLRWKKESFVARFNRDKLEQRNLLAAAQEAALAVAKCALAMRTVVTVKLAHVTGGHVSVASSDGRFLFSLCIKSLPLPTFQLLKQPALRSFAFGRWSKQLVKPGIRGCASVRMESSHARHKPQVPPRGGAIKSKDRDKDDKSTPPSVAGHAICELAVDQAFEFDGGSDFGVQSSAAREPRARWRRRQSCVVAASFPVAYAQSAIGFGSHGCPQKIPVFPGTQSSPEKKKSVAGHRSPRHTKQQNASIPSPLTGAAASLFLSPNDRKSVSVSSVTEKPKREASPRKFLCESLASQAPPMGGHDDDHDDDDHGNHAQHPSTPSRRSQMHHNQHRTSATNQDRQPPTLFMAHHDPTTQTSNVATADTEAEAAAASAASFLTTGEDAIAFFARNGSDSEVKFVHLNRAHTGIAFRPYDLVVVTQDDIVSEHFTMSSSGLVHMNPGNPSEFIALAERMRQSTLFNVLTSFRFFKYYLVNKAFSRWGASVRFKLYCRQRKKPQQKLFFAKTSFCQPLLHVKKVMSTEVLSVVLLDLRAQKTYESTAFVEYQATKRTDAAKQFEACIEKLQAIVQKVFVDVKNLTKLAASDPQDEFLSNETNVAFSLTQGEKTKSIVAVKSEQQQRRKLFKRAAEEAGMIADLIRLIDYVAVESFVVLANQSCREFLQELNKVPRKTGLFETTIFFGEESTIFAPTSEQIQHIVVAMTDDIINTVNSVSCVLYLRPFAPYITNAVADAPHVGLTISTSVDFQQIRKDFEASLVKIKHGWDQMQFTCISHREQKDVFILGSLEDILMLLEDNQVTLQTMMGSRFIMGVKDEVDRWNKKFSLLSDSLDEWITSQRSWTYLETIFCAEDIQKQLPVEAQKFTPIDKNWKTVMLHTNSDPSVIQSIESRSDLLEQFRMSNQILEEIQKPLEDYLKTKRMGFPRFYFLSNDELLEILSQILDPCAVQPHLGKCFDAMKSIRFVENDSAVASSTKHPNNLVNAMISGESEVVEFPSLVTAAGPVETWLVEVEKAMRASLYEDGVKALTNYPIEDAIDRK
ncbi:Dynein heavy chain, partial [Globisporangium splendens]